MRFIFPVEPLTPLQCKEQLLSSIEEVQEAMGASGLEREFRMFGNIFSAKNPIDYFMAVSGTRCLTLKPEIAYCLARLVEIAEDQRISLREKREKVDQTICVWQDQ